MIERATLTRNILIGMAGGLLLGSLIHAIDLADTNPIMVYGVNGLFDIGGKAFVASLKMLVVPLVFVSLVCGASNLSDGSSLGRIGIKTLGLYLFTTAIAITLALTVANIVDQEWLCIYPWPTQIVNDRDGKFTAHDFQNMAKNEYEIKTRPITTRNPRVNATVERLNQVIANITRTFKVQDNYLDEQDPWKRILSATAFPVRSTYHITLKRTSGQIIFARDLIFNVENIAKWEIIQQLF